MHRRLTLFIMLMLALGMIGAFLYCLQIDEEQENGSLISHAEFIESSYGLGIELYQDTETDRWYLFLPSFADEESITVTCSGQVQADFSENGELTLTKGNQTETYEIEILKSQNVPAIYVQTSSGNMDFVNEDKENEEDVAVLVINSEGEEQFSGTGTISGRGVSTWKAPKKPYNLKFSDQVDLLGKESTAKTWCLLANYFDSSQLRNALCYYAADEMGIPYTSDIYYASLYVNGEYYGLYNVVTKQDYKDAEGSEIYAVFEQSKSNKPYDYITDNESYIRFDYGEESYITSVVNDFEDALFNGNLTYEELGNYIDTTSFARKYLVEIFFSNCDIRLSQYYAVDENGIISAICAWDYDRSIGISNFRYVDLSYNMLYMANRWYKELVKYDEFQEEVKELFLEYSDFLKFSEFEYLDQCSEEIRADWDMNAVRWNGQYSKRTALKTTEDLSSLDGNKDYIESFLNKRYDFLNDYWNNPEEYVAVHFDDEEVGNYTVYCKSGLPLTSDQIPDGIMSYAQDGFTGWYTSDGLSLTDADLITEEITFSGVRSGAEEKTPEEEIISAESEEEENGSFLKRAGTLVVGQLKKVYYFFGLESFGKKRLILCAVFGAFFLVLLWREFSGWEHRKRRKNE